MSSPWQSILLSQVPPGNGGTGPKGADFNNQLAKVGWKSIYQFPERNTVTGSDIKLSVWYQQAHTTPKNVTTGSQKWRQGRPSTLQHRSPRFQSLQYYLSSESHGFSSSHGWMWQLDHKEGWAPKNQYFWTVMLEKTIESPLDSKETKPVNPKGSQPWIFIGRTDAEASDAEAPILWSPDAKSQLTGKDPDLGKDWEQEEKGMTEDEMVGWLTDSLDISLSKLRELLMDREAWGAVIHGVSKSPIGLSN